MEREIIKTILDGKLNFSEFFIKHMKKGDRAFLVDKKFITNWAEYTKSKSKYFTGSINILNTNVET
jgi:hypothetical protein